MSLTDEQLEIRSLARAFADQELREAGGEWDQRGSVEGGVMESLAELGFFGILVHPDHGGLGMDQTMFTVIVEELARGDAATALMMALHNAPVSTLIAASGSEAAQRSWLPRLASGEVRGAIGTWGWDRRAPSEAGLPVARVEGDGWSVSGRIKAFGAVGAGLIVVPVREPAGQQEVWVIVDPSQSGVSVTADPTPMGLRAAGGASVLLEEVKVTKDHMLHSGEPESAVRALDQGRLALAAVAVGISASSTEHAVGYALEREQFGRPIGSFGAIRGKLAEMRMRTEAARALIRLAAPRLDEGSTEASGSASAAMARVTAADAVVWVTDEAVQIFGGYGYMKDYPVEKLMRDAQGMQILGGSREALYERVVQPMLSGADSSTMTRDSVG